LDAALAEATAMAERALRGGRPAGAPERVFDRLLQDSSRRQQRARELAGAVPAGCTFAPVLVTAGAQVPTAAVAAAETASGSEASSRAGASGIPVHERLWKRAQEREERQRERERRAATLGDDGQPMFRPQTLPAAPSAAGLRASSPSGIALSTARGVAVARVHGPGAVDKATARLARDADARRTRQARARDAAEARARALAEAPKVGARSAAILEAARRRTMAPVFALLRRSCRIDEADRERRRKVLTGEEEDPAGMGGLLPQLLAGVHPSVPLHALDRGDEMGLTEAKDAAAARSSCDLDAALAFPEVLPPTIAVMARAAIAPEGGGTPGSQHVTFSTFCSRMGQLLERGGRPEAGDRGAWVYGRDRRDRRAGEVAAELEERDAAPLRPSIDENSARLAATVQGPEPVGERLFKRASQQQARQLAAERRATEARLAAEEAAALAVTTHTFRARPAPGAPSGTIIAGGRSQARPRSLPSAGREPSAEAAAAPPAACPLEPPPPPPRQSREVYTRAFELTEEPFATPVENGAPADDLATHDAEQEHASLGTASAPADPGAGGGGGLLSIQQRLKALRGSAVLAARQ